MHAFGKYHNQFFSILGDSMSTLSGYSVPDYAAYYDLARGLESGVFAPSDTWWGQVIDYLHGELLVNNSFSGSTVCWDRQYEIPSYGCSEERTSALGSCGRNPDVIMIFMGLNDWGRGASITAGQDNVDDLTVFPIAYRHMIEQLRSRYPDAEIWCFTFPVSIYSSQEDFTFPFCRGGIHLEKYCEIIRQCCTEFHCRLIDLYAAGTPYDTVDGFHPTAEGMKTIAQAVIEQLIS